MLPYNPILDTDSYKASHWKQYPLGTTSQFAYLESRGGRYDHTVFFGLQAILKKQFLQPITHQMVDEAKAFFAAHGVPFNEAGWRLLVDRHGGKYPITIKAVPEGRVVPTHNLLMSVECSDPDLFWLVSWLETQLLRVWYPITVATQSWHIKRLIARYLLKTADNAAAELPFKLHDFGSRGVSSAESAGIGGAAHLVNFMGSDTIEGVRYANHYYNHPMAAFSIPAAEHSTITSWGFEGELEAYCNMLGCFDGPGKITAIVSDSYDLWEAVEFWGSMYRQNQIKGTVVIRPDSGDPAKVVFEILSTLERGVGVHKNSKGYKVLPPQLRVIQGDGINEESIKEILDLITSNGWSASNVAFGMGGALLQQVNRDTQRFAYKTSSVTVDGVERDVYKAPVTDPGKVSKRGKLILAHGELGYETVCESDRADNAIYTVYKNGELLVDQSLDEIRTQAAVSLMSFI